MTHWFDLAFSLNGELMMDSMGQEIAFRGVEAGAYVPAVTLSCHQQCKLNLGQDVNTLKFFTCCGLQEGYEPFCVYVSYFIDVSLLRFHPVCYLVIEER